MTPLTVVMAALDGLQPTFTSEVQLQTAVADHLTDQGLDVVREVELSGADRIDLYLPGCSIGIEVKIAGSRADVERQLRRYAASPAIEALILVTSRAHHARLPLNIDGVPLRVHSLIGGGL